MISNLHVGLSAGGVRVQSDLHLGGYEQGGCDEVWRAAPTRHAPHHAESETEECSGGERVLCTQHTGITHRANI